MSIVPLGVEMAGATVLVVGGGTVGARKARRFAGAGANIVVLSPEFTADDFTPSDDERTRTEDGQTQPDNDQTQPNDDQTQPNDEQSGTVERIRMKPSGDVADARDWLDLVDPLLVVCAASDEAVNDAFAAAAREAGVLRNRADVAGSEDAGSVVVPATIDDPPVVVSVSTGGRSPALSAYLRDSIENEVAGAGAMAELSGDIRADLKARDVPPAVRRDAVRAVVKDAGVWKALRTGNTNARQVADAVVESVVGTQGST